jgi:AcrR family transcriptional regulator
VRRAEQREQTIERIVDAAVDSFVQYGFEAASTRDIAARAGVTQGLITYHFDSKAALWRAAADRVFTDAATPAIQPPGGDSSPAARRAAVREFVRFNAAHPAFFRFVFDAGRSDDDRMAWLVETHIARPFNQFRDLVGADVAPHAWYALAGAASLIFAVAPEVEALSGVDPTTAAAIDRHADFVADLFAAFYGD